MKIRKLHEVVKQDKVCKACDKLKPYTEYNVCKYTMGGLKHRCRECMTEYSRSYSKVSQAKARIVPEEKECKECECSKDIVEFNKDYSAADGYKNSCRECSSKKRKVYREKNDQVIKHKKREDYRINKEQILRKKREQYALEPQPIRDRQNRYGKNNKAKRVASVNNRRNRIKRSQPKWTSEYKSEMEELHNMRLKLENTTGIKYHLDHIIPLTNSQVSGLDVPWNIQVLSASENTSKNNQFDGTYENESWRKKSWHSTLA